MPISSFYYYIQAGQIIPSIPSHSRVSRRHQLLSPNPLPLFNSSSPATAQKPLPPIRHICGLGASVGCERVERTFNAPRLKAQIWLMKFTGFVCCLLNELNSKVFIDIRNLSTFSVNIKLNTYTYASFLMYGATSRYNGFMYIVFVDVASEKRTVNFIKIADFVASRTFSGTYSDDTSTLTINASETIWGGIKMLMLKQ